MIIKNMPDEEQIKNGILASDYLYFYSIWKALSGKESEKPTTDNPKIKQLGDLYHDGKIDSVTAIYLAMQKD